MKESLDKLAEADLDGLFRQRKDEFHLFDELLCKEEGAHLDLLNLVAVAEYIKVADREVRELLGGHGRLAVQQPFREHVLDEALECSLSDDLRAEEHLEVVKDLYLDTQVLALEQSCEQREERLCICVLEQRLDELVLGKLRDVLIALEQLYDELLTADERAVLGHSLQPGNEARQPIVSFELFDQHELALVLEGVSLNSLLYLNNGLADIEELQQRGDRFELRAVGEDLLEELAAGQQMLEDGLVVACNYLQLVSIRL